MSTFWASVKGRSSSQDKPPSGRSSRSASRGKENDPSRGRERTRGTPSREGSSLGSEIEGDGVSREGDAGLVEEDDQKDDAQDQGCLNMTKLAGQVLGRSGGGVMRVGILPAFSKGGSRTGSLPRHTSSSSSRRSSRQQTPAAAPTPPPTPTVESTPPLTPSVEPTPPPTPAAEQLRPPVPESPKPKVKGATKKRAASASPARDKRRSFRGISRDRFPQLPSMPHLKHMPHLPPMPQMKNMPHLPTMPQMKNMPHLPPMHMPQLPPLPKAPTLPSQLRRFLPRSDSKKKEEEIEPSKPSRRQGPVGRTWVKVYDDITFMDDQGEKEDLYPVLGYTGRPQAIPEANPLPTPPTPPPPRTHQRQPSTESDYDNVPSSKKSTTTEGRIATEDEDIHENIAIQGRGKDRFKGKRQKRTGTPVTLGGTDDGVTDIFMSELESQIIPVEDEDDYIIPGELKKQPPKPPRGHKLYDNIEMTAAATTTAFSVTVEEPAKPPRGIKVYEEVLIRRQQTQVETRPEEEVQVAEKHELQMEVGGEKEGPEQEAIMQQEGQSEDASQATVVEGASNEDILTESRNAAEAEHNEEGICEDMVKVEDKMVKEDLPSRPQRGIKVYDTVELRKEPPTEYTFETTMEQTVSQVPYTDEGEADKREGTAKGLEAEVGSTEEAEEAEILPSRPSRGNKLYASVVIERHQVSGQAVVADVSMKVQESSASGDALVAKDIQAESVELKTEVMDTSENKTGAREIEVDEKQETATESTTETVKLEREEVKTEIKEIKTELEEAKAKIEETKIDTEKTKIETEDVKTEAEVAKKDTDAVNVEAERLKTEVVKTESEESKTENQGKVEALQDAEVNVDMTVGTAVGNDVDTGVPPYARVQKGSGTRELRPLAPDEDEDEPPPPIPPKKKGLRTISPQTLLEDPPRPPRHLKPKLRKSVVLVNGEVSSPSRPPRGSKLYAAVEPVSPPAPKRHSKVVRIEDVITEIKDDLELPTKPSRNAQVRQHGAPPRRKKIKTDEHDEQQTHVLTSTLTVDSTRPLEVNLTAEDDENYENVTPIKPRSRPRPLPPPPPPPKKGKIQQRYQERQKQEQELQQQQQQQKSATNTESKHESTTHSSQPGRAGDVGKPVSGSGQVDSSGTSISHSASTVATTSPSHTDNLETDIDDNLKTIESSFAALDNVLKSLQTYSGSSAGRVVRGESATPTTKALPHKDKTAADTVTQKAATSQTVITIQSEQKSVDKVQPDLVKSSEVKPTEVEKSTTGVADAKSVDVKSELKTDVETKHKPLTIEGVKSKPEIIAEVKSAEPKEVISSKADSESSVVDTKSDSQKEVVEVKSEPQAQKSDTKITTEAQPETPPTEASAEEQTSSTQVKFRSGKTVYETLYQVDVIKDRKSGLRSEEKSVPRNEETKEIKSEKYQPQVEVKQAESIFPGIKLETSSECKLETTLAPKVETTSESKVDTSSELKVETSLEPKIETTESKVDTTSESKVETSSELKVNTSLETASESKVETSSELKLNTSLEPKIETTSESKVEASSELKVDTSLEPKVETALESRLETTLESQVETSLEPTLETTRAKVETTPEPKAESEFKVDTISEPVETASDYKVDTTSASRVETSSEIKVETTVEPRIEAIVSEHQREPSSEPTKEITCEIQKETTSTSQEATTFKTQKETSFETQEITLPETQEDHSSISDIPKETSFQFLKETTSESQEKTATVEPQTTAETSTSKVSVETSSEIHEEPSASASEVSSSSELLKDTISTDFQSTAPDSASQVVETTTESEPLIETKTSSELLKELITVSSEVQSQTVSSDYQQKTADSEFQLDEISSVPNVEVVITPETEVVTSSPEITVEIITSTSDASSATSATEPHSELTTQERIETIVFEPQANTVSEPEVEVALSETQIEATSSSCDPQIEPLIPETQEDNSTSDSLTKPTSEPQALSTLESLLETEISDSQLETTTPTPGETLSGGGNLETLKSEEDSFSSGGGATGVEGAKVDVGPCDSTELVAGVADIATRLEGIRSTLESVIFNYPSSSSAQHKSLSHHFSGNNHNLNHLPFNQDLSLTNTTSTIPPSTISGGYPINYDSQTDSCSPDDLSSFSSSEVPRKQQRPTTPTPLTQINSTRPVEATVPATQCVNRLLPPPSAPRRKSADYNDIADADQDREQESSFALRRSFMAIFSSLGKGGRQVTQKHSSPNILGATSGGKPQMKESPKTASQFYVDLPSTSTTLMPLPDIKIEIAPKCTKDPELTHRHPRGGFNNNNNNSSAVNGFLNGKSKELSYRFPRQCDPDPELRSVKDENEGDSHVAIRPQRDKRYQKHHMGVLVFPESVQESLVQRSRFVRQFESNDRNLKPSTMGLVFSQQTETEDEKNTEPPQQDRDNCGLDRNTHTTVGQPVRNRYVSVLAELTLRAFGQSSDNTQNSSTFYNADSEKDCTKSEHSNDGEFSTKTCIISDSDNCDGNSQTTESESAIVITSGVEGLEESDNNNTKGEELVVGDTIGDEIIESVSCVKEKPILFRENIDIMQRNIQGNLFNAAEQNLKTVITECSVLEVEEEGSESEPDDPEIPPSNSDDLSWSDPCMTLEVQCDPNPLLTNSPDLTPKPSPDILSEEKRNRKIFLIAQEIMTSERVFVDVLRLLNVDFREHVLRSRVDPSIPTIQEDDLNKILNYLPQLQNLNEELLKDLEDRIADWERHRKIADVIVQKGPFLKLYSAYIKEFQTQNEYLDQCAIKYPLFGRALKEFEASDRCAKLSVKHYMLKPVQRLPQYRLLLEDYLSKLLEDSPDYLDTQTALAVVANVATHANETMKQGTNFMKMLSLQYRLSHSHQTSNGDSSNRYSGYELVRPGRSLLKEGELLKLCRRGMSPRYYILLSDVLLYTSYIGTSGLGGGALRLNYELPLEGMRVETPKAEDFKNEFSVISTSRSFTLQASTAEERDEWIQALREAIEDNASRRSTFMQAKMSTFPHTSTSTLGKQAPVWIPDYRVTMCQQCTAEFTLTFRRHHCRACGKVVCDHCSANRAPLQYKKNQAARVCDTCFEILQKDFECRYEGSVNQEDPHESRVSRVISIKSQFKRGIRDSNRNRIRKKNPDRLLEVVASDTASQMCGYLRAMIRRSWRRGWYVLKDRVLYEYRAPQDVCALHSLPVLGYEVEKVQEVADGVDTCLAFQLTHPNQAPLIFHTDSPHLAEKWIQAMKEAVVLT